MKTSSRRTFLKTGLGTVLAGAAAGTGLVIAKAEPARAQSATHPYGYPTPSSGLQLDVEETRQRGYDGYKGIEIDGAVHKHCGFATFNAIVGGLADKVGAPYSAIPTQMMEWAAGGAAGFASFCGALNGACAAIGLICGNGDAKLFISDLLSWYADTMLPTNRITNDAFGELPQSRAGANLCHVSVTRWCEAAGYASGSSARSERCARLAGDVAAAAVDMLNNGILGLPVPGDNTTCRACHYKGPNPDTGQFTRGKMDCEACHVELPRIVSGKHVTGRGGVR